MTRTVRLVGNARARSARTAMIAIFAAAVAGGCGHVTRLADAGMSGGKDGGAQPDAMGSSNPDAGSACGGKTIALSDAANCVVRAFCAYIIRCEGQYDSVDQCVQNGAAGLAPNLDNSFKQYMAAVAAGKIKYDPNAAAQCLGSVASASCSGSGGGGGAVCAAVFSGDTTDGAACYFGEECGVGGECQGASGTGSDACTMGTCVTAAQLGQPCDMRPCVPGALCVQDSTGARSCQSGKAGSPCMADSDCQEAFYCSSSKQCAADLGDGATCTTDAQCAAPELCVGGKCAPVDQPNDACQTTCFGGLYCAVPMGASSGQCTALPALNQSCAQSHLCNHFDLYCNANQICAQRPTAGQPCRAGDCMPGLFCTAAAGSGTSGTCAQPQANGTSCTQSTQCQSGNCAMSGSSGTCQSFALCY